MESMLGLVHAFRFEESGHAEELNASQLPDSIPSDGGLWVHLDANEEDARRWLDSLPDMPSTVVEALFEDETRPRATRIGDGLILTLRGVNLNPGSDPSDMVSLRIWVTQHFIVTTRRRRLLSVQSLAALIRDGKGPGTPADILVGLADALTSRMADTIQEMEEALSDLEEAIGSSSAEDQRPELVRRRLETVRLRRFLVPQKEAMLKLGQEMLPWLEDEHRLQIKQSTNHLIRYLEELDSLRERSLLLQEEFVNLQTEKMNGRMYILSLLSAIFLPLGFLTGLFGINIAGMPGTDFQQAFWLFCICLLGMGGVLYWVLKRSRWF